MLKIPHSFIKRIRISLFVLVPFFLAVCAFVPSPLYAGFVPNVPIMPLSQLKPGMTGDAYTVISGTKISSFKVEIVGVMPQKSSPKNLILFKIMDKDVNANGGVAAGMSGSPIYVEGRLIGAIGYSFSFADRSLGLATPIEEMIRAFDWPDSVPKFGVPKAIPQNPVSMDKTPTVSQDIVSKNIVSKDVTSSDVSSDIKIKETEGKDASVKSGDAVSKDNPLREKSYDISTVMRQIENAKIRPLAMPLSVSGMSPKMASMLEKKLGITLIPFGASTSGETTVSLNTILKPGSAMGVSLAWGDVLVGGIGTLSAVDDKGRFLAFAHPMMGQGAVAFPVTDASIIKIIPSINHSFKLGYTGKIIGLMTQDRPEAIGGYMGKLAPASSYTVNFHDMDTNKKDRKRFQTITDSFVGPAIGTAGITGIIEDLWGRTGEGTAIVKYRFSGGNLVSGWERGNVFFSDKDLVKSMFEEFEDLADIFSLNQFQEIRPFGVDVSVEITREPRVVFIEKLEIADKKEFYSPGDKVSFDVTLRPWRKQAQVKRVELTIPQKAMGFCEILVRGGGIEEPNSESLASGVRSISDINMLLKELSAKESNNQVIFEIKGPDGKLKDKNPKDLSPMDFIDDRLVSELKLERLKEGTLKIMDTNCYVEGRLRKFIKIKGLDANAEQALAEMEAMLGSTVQDNTTREKPKQSKTKPEDEGELWEF